MILVSGEPGNVVFDYPTYITVPECFSEAASLVYYPVPASIDGWIKRDWPFTRMSPATWPYDCDINIECEVDGKPLKLHITRMNDY